MYCRARASGARPEGAVSTFSSRWRFSFHGERLRFDHHGGGGYQAGVSFVRQARISSIRRGRALADGEREAIPRSRPIGFHNARGPLGVPLMFSNGARAPRSLMGEIGIAPIFLSRLTSRGCAGSGDGLGPADPVAQVARRVAAVGRARARGSAQRRRGLALFHGVLRKGAAEPPATKCLD